MFRFNLTKTIFYFYKLLDMKVLTKNINIHKLMYINLDKKVMEDDKNLSNAFQLKLF